MRRQHTGQAGFSLIEALVAMAVMGMVLAGLASVTGQWLPNWSHGFASVQRNAVLSRGMERLVADIAAAEYVPLGGGADAQPLFIGASQAITLVRRAIGPNTEPGLEIVRIAEAAGANGSILVRRRARFVPRNAEDRRLPPLRDPVVLLSAPYRVTFSYAGGDRKWRDYWVNAKQLPRTVRILVRDTATEQVLPASTAVTLHVDAPPACQPSDKGNGCGDQGVAQAGTATKGDDADADSKAMPQ